MIKGVALYGQDAFTATFNNAVGALTVLVHVVGKLVVLEIPAGSTSDGGGAAIQSGATDVPSEYRPQADISFPVVVTENGAKATGKLVVTSAGRMNFYKDAASGNFTDNAAAGWDRCRVSFLLA